MPAKAVTTEYPEHLIDSHIKKSAAALIEQIVTKSRDIDGVVLTYEQATEIALEVIKGEKK